MKLMTVTKRRSQNIYTYRIITARISGCPNDITTLTLDFGNVCKISLKSGYRSTINRILRQVVVDVNHPENRAGEQCPMGFDFHPVTIQLLRVAMSTSLGKAFCVERQKPLKKGVTFDKHTLVQFFSICHCAL